MEQTAQDVNVGEQEARRAVENLRQLLSAVHKSADYTHSQLMKLAFHVEAYTGKVVCHLVSRACELKGARV